MDEDRFGVPIDTNIGIPNNGDMTTSEVLAYFGSRPAIAAALGIKVPSVYDWGEHPPPLRQIQLERITDGALQAESNVFVRGSGQVAPSIVDCK